MNRIASVLLFVASAMAKGRGRGGSGGSGGFIDDWDAAPLVKTQVAFQIIWAVLDVILLLYILQRLANIPSWSPRGPYILLIFSTLGAIAYRITWAIDVRIDVIDREISSQIDLALTFLGGIIDPLRPAAVLYLLHLRGGVLRAVQGNTISLLACKIWKRILDWSLVFLSFVLTMTLLGVRNAWYTTWLNFALTRDLYDHYVNVTSGLIHAIMAFVILLAIDVAVSLVIHFVQTKRAQWNDPVTSRLLFVAAPFSVIYALEILVYDIYVHVALDYDPDALTLASIIIEGACEVAILFAFLLTLMAANVQWTHTQVGAPMAYASPPQQWSTTNSGWSQPLVNQQQQQSYFQQPQQQPYFQQPQQQQQQQAYYPPPAHPPPQHLVPIPA